MIKKNSDVLVLIILWIFSSYSIISIISDNYGIGIPNYLGYGLLILVTGLRFKKPRNYNKILSIFLLLGTLNIIQFTYWTQTFFFRINPKGDDSFTWGLQPLSFALFLFFIIVNFSGATKFLFHSTDQNNSDLIKSNYENLLNKTDNELHNIIEKEKDFEKETVLAARIIIRERNNKGN